MSDTLMLHTPERGKKRHYCGPTAIAAITGLPYDTIYRKIRRLRNERGRAVKDSAGRKKPIRGLGNWDTLEVLRRCGFKPKLTAAPGGTLMALLKDRGHIKAPMLINVTDHYIVVAGGQLVDTHTRGLPIPMMEYHKLRFRVERYWQF